MRYDHEVMWQVSQREYLQEVLVHGHEEGKMGCG